MKKSILAMLLAAVMVLSLTACGEEAVSSSDVVEESSTVVEESSDVVEESTEAPAEESTEAPAEESTEAPAEEETTAPAADTTFSKDGYSIKQLGDHKVTNDSGFDIFMPETPNGNNYSAILQKSKLYSTEAEFLAFGKDSLNPALSVLFPGGQDGSISSHKFSKRGNYNSIEMTFKRTIEGVTYTEHMIWVDIVGGGVYQFEFFSKDGDPVQIYADVIASIKVA